MSWEWALLLAVRLFLRAANDTTVGHAGASAYITIMTLFGMAPVVMRPTALVLSIIVSVATTAALLDKLAEKRLITSLRRRPGGST